MQQKFKSCKMKRLFLITYLFLSNAVISQSFFISQLGADIDGEAAEALQFIQ